MTRVILHLAKAIAAIITLLLFFSCGLDKERIEGSGNVITQQRNAGTEFNSVSASGDVDVIIEQGAQRAITVEADDNLQQHIKTEVKGGTLDISTDVNFSSPKATRITVILPEIKEIESAASARVKNKGSLKTEDLSLHASSGSLMELSIDVQEVSYEASSGSNMKISGKAVKTEASASSGGKIYAEGVASNKVKAEASSGGRVNIDAIDDLNANASSGGSVLYVNTPANLSKDVSSGGKVEQKQ